MKNIRNNLILKCIILLLVIVIGLLSAYYAVIKIKNDEMSSEDFPSTAYDILVDRDLDISYPATPSEVLKLYNKYLKYIYNTPLSDEEFDNLVDKIRQMWSKEWLELNERTIHIATFREEVKNFMDDGKIMSNYTVSESSTAESFVTPAGVDGKTLMSSYLYSKKKTTSKVYMKFYFLNEDNKWKILYYEIVDEAGNNKPVTDAQDVETQAPSTEENE